jgi:hypothetical protein
MSLASGPDGSVYTTFQVNGEYALDEVSGVIPVPTGGLMVVAKLDGNGHVLWLREVPRGAGFVTTLADGRPVVAGEFGADLSFFSAEPAGNFQFCVAILDPDDGSATLARCSTSKAKHCDWRIGSLVAVGDELLIDTRILDGSCSFEEFAASKPPVFHELGVALHLDANLDIQHSLRVEAVNPGTQVSVGIQFLRAQALPRPSVLFHRGEVALGDAVYVGDQDAAVFWNLDLSIARAVQLPFPIQDPKWPHIYGSDGAGSVVVSGVATEEITFAGQAIEGTPEQPLSFIGRIEANGRTSLLTKTRRVKYGGAPLVQGFGSRLVALGTSTVGGLYNDPTQPDEVAGFGVAVLDASAKLVASVYGNSEREHFTGPQGAADAIALSDKTLLVAGAGSGKLSLGGHALEFEQSGVWFARVDLESGGFQ